ncbi:MAG: metal ABC transporter permease [Pseudanabaenaceae cyanobacterium]
MWDWLLAPLQFPFMVRAILVAGVVGAVCALLSCYLILKGWALMGDAVSHSVLPGVVLAYALNIPYGIGAFVFGVGAVLLIGFIQQQTRIKEDTAIGLVFTGFFALGLVLISKVPTSVDLAHILFGNPLGIPDSELWQTLIASGITATVILLLHRDLLLFCFDPVHVQGIGLNVNFLYYLLLVLLSLTIVAALQTVGVILVIAMLITPGATAYLWCDRFLQMMLVSVGLGVGASLGGTYLSYYLDASTGGCIVLLQTIIFLLSLVIAPKHGLLSYHRTEN